MTTKLAAVQQIAAQLGLTRPIALETGQATEAGKIESILDETNARMQQRGIGCNTYRSYALPVPLVKIVVSGGAGTFTFGETVTESVSGATGTFNRIESGSIYLARVSGTFAGGQTLTGGTSGATRTGGTYTLQTSSKIGIPSSWLFVGPSNSSSFALTTQGVFLFNTTDSTLLFTSDQTVTVIDLLAFDSLPFHWAEAVVWRAAVDAQRSFKRSTTDESVLTQQAIRAYAEAINLDSAATAPNVFANTDSLRGLGILTTNRDIRYV